MASIYGYTSVKIIRLTVLSGGSLVVVWLFNWILSRMVELYHKYRKLCNLPVVNLRGWHFSEAQENHVQNVRKWLQIGRSKYGDTGYQLFTPEGYTVVIPEAWAEEVKSASDSTLDSLDIAFKRIGGGYGWTLLPSPAQPRIIQRHLMTRLGVFGASASDEIGTTIRQMLPKNDEWIEINTSSMLSKLAASSISTTYISDDIAHDPILHGTVIQASISFAMTGRKLREYSYFGKIFASYFGSLEEMRQNRACLSTMRGYVVPILRQRLTDAKKPDYKPPNDMLQWHLDEFSKPSDSRSLEDISDLLVFMFYPAILTMTTLLTEVIYRLVFHPEYLEPLRSEIDGIWESCDGGQLDHASTMKMIKLDSFLKETHRCTEVGNISNIRQVRAPNGITFSSGLHLPKGSVFAVDAPGVSLDPNQWQDPEDFRGFRHVELRESDPENAAGYYFSATSTKHSMKWGYGNHSCPGRYLAAFHMKLMLAHLLRDWDIRAEERMTSYMKGAELRKDIKILVKSRQH